MLFASSIFSEIQTLSSIVTVQRWRVVIFNDKLNNVQ